MVGPMQSTSPHRARRRSTGRIVRRVLGVVLALVVLGGLVAGGVALARAASNARDDRAEERGSTCDPSDDPDDTRNRCLYPDRPDQQPDDHEAEVGHAVRLAGYTTTVEAGFMHELVLADQLGIRVTIENRDGEPQPYGPNDFKVQARDGSLVTSVVNERDDALGTGELDQGESVTGTILFELPPGTYDVIYRPDLFNRGRGVWRITAEPPE
jgi:hypothetical protein